MEQPVLVINAPELSDEGVASVTHFLQEFIQAFENHYYSQILRYHKKCRDEPLENDKDQFPF